MESFSFSQKFEKYTEFQTHFLLRKHQPNFKTFFLMKDINSKKKILIQSLICKIYIPVAFTLQSISATNFSRNSVPPDISPNFAEKGPS